MDMIETKRLDSFSEWLEKQDKTIIKRVEATIAKVELGNLGDHKQLDDLTHEIRLHFSSGIRLYYMWQEKQLVLLLAGGDKSTQEKDIRKAKSLAREIAEGRIKWTR